MALVTAEHNVYGRVYVFGESVDGNAGEGFCLHTPVRLGSGELKWLRTEELEFPPHQEFFQKFFEDSGTLGTPKDSIEDIKEYDSGCKLVFRKWQQEEGSAWRGEVIEL